MVAISRARLYFGTGVAFEKKWLEKMAAANPGMQVIHTDRGIKKRPMAADHSHREAGHHKSRQAQNSLDPHIWLAPPLVKVQARTITNALIGCDPGHRSDYEANYLELAAGIDRLDAELKKLFAGQKGLRFMVFHPSWGYFAETYGLAQVPIEIEGKEPKPAQLKALIEQARREDIKMVFVQPQLSTKSADIIAREIGGQVVFADPLAEDWMANLRSVAVKFKAALK